MTEVICNCMFPYQICNWDCPRCKEELEKLKKKGAKEE